MEIKHGTALALALALTASAAGAGDTPLPPGFEGGRAYSNLCIDPEGGDVGGYRITVKGSGARTRIAVEVGQGGLTGPFMAHIHPGKTGKIAFSIPREELGDGLQGIVRGDVAVIHVPGDTPPIQRLRRRNDVHGFRACR